MNLYETLGVAPIADAAVIKAAYRRLAMLHHPDRGGNKEAMQAVQDAYDVLSDPERRAQYDAGGGTERTLSPEEMAAAILRANALSLIRGSLVKALQSVDEAKNNVLDVVRDTLRSAQAETQKQIDGMLEGKAKAERAARRIVADDDTLVSVLHGLAQSLDGPIAQAMSDLQQVLLALSILDGAKYAVDLPTDEEVEANMRDFQEMMIRKLHVSMGVPPGMFRSTRK